MIEARGGLELQSQTTRGMVDGKLNGHNDHAFSAAIGDATLIVSAALGTAEPVKVFHTGEAENKFLVFPTPRKDFTAILPAEATTVVVLPARKGRKSGSLAIRGSGRVSVTNGVITHLALGDHTRVQVFDTDGSKVYDASPTHYITSFTAGVDSRWGGFPLPATTEELPARILLRKDQPRREDSSRPQDDPIRGVRARKKAEFDERVQRWIDQGMQTAPSMFSQFREPTPTITSSHQIGPDGQVGTPGMDGYQYPSINSVDVGEKKQRPPLRGIAYRAIKRVLTGAKERRQERKAARAEEGTMQPVTVFDNTPSEVPPRARPGDLPSLDELHLEARVRKKQAELGLTDMRGFGM